MARSVTPHPTPNPNAIRFGLGENVLGERSVTFASAAAARGTGWAERLFGLPGVASLFGVKDFLTVVKTPAGDWNAIVPRAVEILSTTDFRAASGG